METLFLYFQIAKETAATDGMIGMKILRRRRVSIGEYGRDSHTSTVKSPVSRTMGSANSQPFFQVDAMLGQTTIGFVFSGLKVP